MSRNEDVLDERLHGIMDDIEELLADGGKRQEAQLMHLSDDLKRIIEIRRRKRDDAD